MSKVAENKKIKGFYTVSDLLKLDEFKDVTRRRLCYALKKWHVEPDLTAGNTRLYTKFQFVTIKKALGR